MKILQKNIFIALVLLSAVAVSDPIKIQYRLGNETYTGWLEYLNYQSQNNQFETGAGFGFARDLDYPAEPSAGQSFYMDSHDAAFLFGSNWIGANASLKYNDGIFSSYTYGVNHFGVRQIDGANVLYFDLGQDAPR